jgi:ribosomal protein L11 methyltransferase
MFELVLSAPETLVEPVSEALMNELEALSVSVEDADADTDAEKALFGEPGMPAARPGWNRSTLKALFQTEEEASQAATLLLAQDWATELQVQALQPVAEQDWVRLTQSQFSPVEITERFWIVPSWHEPPAQAREVIRLDPGLAFGTGTHPTTRMCLRWIARQAPRWRPAGTACWTTAAAPASWPSVPPCTAPGRGCGGHRPRRGGIHPGQCPGQRRHGARRPARAGAGRVPAGAGQHPGHAAQAAGAAAVRPCARRGHLVLAGILERQAEELQAAYAPGCRCRCWTARTAGS